MKKFNLDGTEHIKIPIGLSQELSGDDTTESVDHTLYKSMTLYSICVCARYQSNPKITHLKTVKRIIRYVVGTFDFGIWYTKDINTNLVGFNNSDWACDLNDRKNTFGRCFYLGSNLVSWYSRK